MTSNLKILVAAVLLAGLSACGGDDNTSSAPAPTPPPTGTTPPPSTPAPTTVAGQISAAFGSIFAANANTEPKDPAPGDLGSVNRMAEPINF
jgi:hypothetical protein